MTSTENASKTATKSVVAAREKCHILYEGERTDHRSCGIALAETFDLPTASYQALRKGGITGRGPCGAIQAGRLVLGELLGDPSPTGATTKALIQAVQHYDSKVYAIPALRPPAPGPAPENGPDVVCNTLTGRFPIFNSPERHRMCTAIARDVAGLVAEVLTTGGHAFTVSAIADVDDFDPDSPNAV